MDQITFITPTFNRANVLPKLAETVFKQTDNNWNWIIVDDGSTDSTKSLVHSWNNSKIKYIYQANSGPSSARNTALRSAGTKWVAYIDSDNELYLNYTSRLLSYINNNPAARYFWPIAKRTKEFYENEVLTKLIDETKNYPKVLNVLDIVHRKVKFDGNGFLHSLDIFHQGTKWDENLNMIEDFDFFLSIAEKYPDLFCYVPEVLLNYHLKFGTDSLVSNTKWLEHANATEYVYSKHKDDKLMVVPGQTWYPNLVEKYKVNARNAGELN